MTERERLLAILKTPIYPHELVDPVEAVADFLLDHGVKVPVMCKDCKHWHEETGWCYHHSHFIGSDGEACHPWESNNWKMLDADDFCSYGERSANGEESND